MDGSSSTYSTPVVRLRTARASCIRWRSPVESVDGAAVQREVAQPQIEQPTCRCSVNDSQMLSAMGRISGGQAVRHAVHPAAELASAASVQASSSEMPRSRGARAAPDRRVPRQSGQISSFRNFSTRFMPFSSLTLARAFSTV